MSDESENPDGFFDLLAHFIEGDVEDFEGDVGAIEINDIVYRPLVRVDTDQPLRAPDPPVLIEPLDEDIVYRPLVRVDTDQPLRAPDPPVLIEPLDEDLGTIYTTSDLAATTNTGIAISTPLRERELEELNRLREENAELRAALELEVQERRIREYRLVVARRLQQQGVPVEFMPDEVYPRMPYLILGPFMEKRDRAYSLNHALRLIRRGVIHALTVAGCKISVKI